MNDSQQEYVRTSEAAAMLNISTTYAWNVLRREGLQKYRRWGNRYAYWKRSDIQALVDRQQFYPADDPEAAAEVTS